MYSIIETFKDYNGNEITDEFCFNLNETELLDMEYDKGGSLTDRIKAISEVKTPKELIDIFKDLLIKSYGVKSLDGRHFVKNEQITKEFTESPAFGKIYKQLATNAKMASDFINGIVPKDI